MARTEQDIHDIAVELKQIRKVLERIAQAPIFSLKEENNIHYLCDEKACSDCSHDECEHTLKIEHARNFYLDRDSGVYIELDSNKLYNLPQ